MKCPFCKFEHDSRGLMVAHFFESHDNDELAHMLYGALASQESQVVTRRDQFAMAALAGLCAHPDYALNAIPERAYSLADAMERERLSKGNATTPTTQNG